MDIPFNRPTLAGNELLYIQQTISESHLSGDGPFTQKCNRLLEQELSVPKVLLTTSCTHAMEMFPLLLDLRKGDEVILPSFTFPSTANAFALRGVKPVFVDIRRDTLNIDETCLEDKINSHTKAIVLVHYAGVACEMDVVLELARHKNLLVLEDNAHGLFGNYKGKNLGTFGALAAQSFHETKNFTCGEGGALFINDPDLIEKAEIVREKGTDRSRFYRGQVDKYSWVSLGSSYLPAEILAAFLFAQLEKHQEIQRQRKIVWDRYMNGLESWAAKHAVSLPFIPSYCEQSYHIFYILLPNLAHRQSLITHLRNHGIASAFHYLPLHLSKMGREFGGYEGLCPVTEEISDCLLRLPFYTSLTEVDQQKVIEAVQAYDF